MNQSVEIPINRYVILSAEYSSFAFLGPKFNFLNVGDILTLIEIDSLGSRTGNAFISEVIFLTTEAPEPEDRTLTFYYCRQSIFKSGVGISLIGISFEVN